MDKNTNTESFLTKRDLVLIGDVVDGKLTKFSKSLDLKFTNFSEVMENLVDDKFEKFSKVLELVMDDKVEELAIMVSKSFDATNKRIDFVHADLSSQLAIHRTETREAIAALEPTGYVKNTFQSAA